MKQGTDWNTHHGVGATLLENWVEERAVGNLIEEERADIKNLSRNGHQNLVANCKNWQTPKSTTMEAQESAYQTISKTQSKNSLRTRRDQLEAEMLKMAISEHQLNENVPSAKEWISVTQEDFSRQDFHARKLEKYRQPITFWTDFAIKGNGTTICSGNMKEQKNQDPFACNPAPVSFGRHSEFSMGVKGATK